MKYIKRFFLISILFFSSNVQAATETAWEVEVDPLAYALSGYSLHVIRAFPTFRIDFGVFGLEQPSAIVGNEKFKTDSRGYGFKIDYTGRDIAGFFVGFEVNAGQDEIRHKDSGEVVDRRSLSSGFRVGYRFGRDGFYVTPWVGIGYIFPSDDVVIQNERYEDSSLHFFPTVHVGYRF